MFDVFVGLGSTQVTTPVGYNSCKARNNIWKEFQVAVQFVGRSPALPTTPPKKRGWDARVTQNQIDARVNALRVFPAVSMVDQKGAYTYFCQGFHCTTCRSRCLPWIQHPWYDERSRGVILKGREIKGFLDSGMAGIYEVKREPGHMVEHLSTAALDLAMLRAQSQHHRFGPDEKCLTS